MNGTKDNQLYAEFTNNNEIVNGLKKQKKSLPKWYVLIYHVDGLFFNYDKSPIIQKKG